MTDSAPSAQERRIVRVCDYIRHHLDDELTLDTLSGVAALSKFHFHRIFSAHTGQSLGQFVLLARLKRASFRLAFETERQVIDIAYEAGFSSPEAFSRAFRRVFGQSPSAFRISPEWPVWHARLKPHPPSSGETAMIVEIVYFQETEVALIEHRGPPETVLDTAGKFIAWRKETGLSPVKISRTFGVPYNDPNTTAPEDFRFDICGSVAGPVPANGHGVKAGAIPGGRCARVRHHGSHDAIDETVYALYRDWLPQSGEAVRDFPCFFHYLNFVHDVDECDLLTDIYLPLE